MYEETCITGKKLKIKTLLSAATSLRVDLRKTAKCCVILHVPNYYPSTHSSLPISIPSRLPVCVSVSISLSLTNFLSIRAGGGGMDVHRLKYFNILCPAF